MGGSFTAPFSFQGAAFVLAIPNSGEVLALPGGIPEIWTAGVDDGNLLWIAIMEAVAPRICFPAKSQCLESIRAFCREILESHTRDQQLHRRLVLAIDEAVANVIEHAYSTNRGEMISTIELSIEVRQDRIVVRILDRGVPFDPRSVEAGPARQPDAAPLEGETFPLHFAEVKVSPSTRRAISSFHKRGFGLQLIRLIMDEIDYQRTPHGENLLILTKRLRKGGDA